MPEYLSPGVFIEEIPARLKAIEGVSTSTAGFVGVAQRGPVPGFPLPFVNTTPALVFLPKDDSPALVTSFADYVRLFGPLPLTPTATDRNFLGHAKRAFFDNGGKRAFVARVVHIDSESGAAYAKVQLGHGTVLRLAALATRGATVLRLTSLRTIGPNSKLHIHKKVGGTPLDLTVMSVDAQAGTVTINSALKSDCTPDDTFVTVDSASPPSGGGPTFFSRSPGTWANKLQVLITNSDRPPTPIVASTTSSDVLPVQNAGSFYVGAIVEIQTQAAPEYHLVNAVLPGNLLQLDKKISVTLPPPPPSPNPPKPFFARVVELDVTILDTSTGAVETFRGCGWGATADPAFRARHYANVVNVNSKLAYVQPPDKEGTGTGDQPMTSDGFPVPLLGGQDGTPADQDFIGVDNGPGNRSGIQSLQDLEDISIIACPGETADDIQQALITQCENMRYRFAILDGEQTPGVSNGVTSVTSILTHRNNYSSAFAAYYTPWVQIDNGTIVIDLPPSGYVAGIYARVDNDRGVWKAPANEALRNITGLDAYITTGEQDILNPSGVDCIRRFAGRGILVWGARTLASDPEVKYVNVKRYLIYLEHSLDKGTQWVVFEPNAAPTWTRVVDSVTAFLHTQWRVGALFGAKPEDAFYVRCDETTMSADDIQNGRLICDIGVAIVRPAEFVIFRIEQITGFGTAA